MKLDVVLRIVYVLLLITTVIIPPVQCAYVSALHGIQFLCVGFIGAFFWDE